MLRVSAPLQGRAAQTVAGVIRKHRGVSVSPLGYVCRWNHCAFWPSSGTSGHTRVHFTPLSLSFSALVWGSSVKHNPQKVGKDHVMEDEDVIQLVKK